MLFNSIQFLLFFPIVCVLYYAIPDKIKNLHLLIASYFFYMCWNPYYSLLLLFSTTVTFICGLLLEKIPYKSGKKFTIGLCVVLEIGLITYFKYSTFILSNLNYCLKLFGWNPINIKFDILLPVGISFYTFQALGYIIDVYRTEISAEKNFINYALYVSFFPQLVAGPIERSKHFLPQLKENHKFDFYQMRDGVLLMLYGFFQKIVIADRLAKIVDEIFNNWSIYPGYFIIGAIFAFSLQIYCDFGGYSNIAIGAAKVLGFELTQNFRQPYLARNMHDFWKRWHISLTSWFKDYLYIPLGGNRGGRKASINILIVFAISGLWHGASWHYVVWGILNGLFQEFGKVIRKAHFRTQQKINYNKNNFLIIWIQRIITFALAAFTWLFFRANSVKTALQMCVYAVRNIFVNWKMYIYIPGIERYEYGMIIISFFLLLMVDIFHENNTSIHQLLASRSKGLRWFCYIALIFIVVFWGVYGGANNENAFIYFQF